jgi:hypothetical protein
MPKTQGLLLNQQQMGCGGCGGSTFKVYTPDKTALIVLECDACKSTSLIEPEPASLKIEWGDGDGRITVL